MREDIFTIARYGTRKGLRMVMGTSGILIDEMAAQEIRDSGIRKVAISIDSPDPAVHDRFRGLPGAWNRAVQGIRNIGKAGVGVQINMTVLSPDFRAIQDVVSLGTGLGVSDYQVFFPVPTGRGSTTSFLTPEIYEDLIRKILVTWQDSGIRIRPTCAPQFRRIADSLGIRNPSWGKGCIAGISYARIFANGDVTPCPYLPARAGNLRTTPLRTIWEESGVFSVLRDPDLLTGKCGNCGYRTVCGGCRARSYETGRSVPDLCGGIARPGNPEGELCGEDPWCRYTPPKEKSQDGIIPDPADRKLLLSLQDDIPLVPRPYREIAARIGTTEDDVIQRLGRLQEMGIVRGLSPVIESRNVGLSAATLVALRVPESSMPAVIRQVNAYPEVSHNYRRDHPYSLWFTITGKSESRIREILGEIGEKNGLSGPDILELPTVRRFKIDVRFSFPENHGTEAGNGSG